MPAPAVLVALALAAAPPVAPPPAPQGAEAVPSRIVLAPAVARPGDAVLVRVRPLAGGPPIAGSSLAGRPLRFFAHGGESWALGALPLETAPGKIRVEIVESELDRVRSYATLEVVEPGFPSKRLSVAPRFVTPPASVKTRIQKDQAAFAAAYDRPFVPPLFTASFAWPHPGAHHGRYGDQRVFNGKKESVHYGLDIDAPRGAPVRAANDGEVVLARDCYYSGKTVVIWHGADLFTLYFHMDRLDVRPGAKVRQGDKLGIVGSTGRSTGPHLHWSAKAAGLLVDPESLMAIDFTMGSAPPRRAGPPPPTPEEEPPAPAPPPEAAGTTTAAAPPR
jgi:murein DD-endopeptidase MepM/ murein hydrolase activator NlpD